jgi:hypothetical protein
MARRGRRQPIRGGSHAASPSPGCPASNSDDGPHRSAEDRSGLSQPSEGVPEWNLNS